MLIVKCDHKVFNKFGVYCLIYFKRFHGWAPW